MAGGSWIEKRSTGSGVRYRVRYRLGGRESKPRFAGSFKTRREAKARAGWVAVELAGRRLPDLSTLAEPKRSSTLREAAARWSESRKDVRDSTKIQHWTALGRVLPLLGSLPVEEITVDDVQRMVDALTAAGKARESIRKSKTALAMILDHVAIEPNPARSKRVKLPLEEPEEVEPPIAEHVEAAAWMLAPSYVLGVLVLDATGARIGELEAATIGDLDESTKRWLVRAKVAKTRKARWVELPDDLYDAVCGLLPAREDRELEAPLFPIGSADRLRTAIGRACRDAGVPSWSPHHLRHRRISLLHHEGGSWAEIGAKVGQRNLSVTADTYSHALFDYREIDRAKLLKRVRMVHPSVHPSGSKNFDFAGAF